MDRSRYKKVLVKIRDIIIGLIRRAPDRHESQKIKKRFDLP
jgi:hypothetical protein